jgi:hypothetical protein
METETTSEQQTTEERGVNNEEPTGLSEQESREYHKELFNKAYEEILKKKGPQIMCFS